MLMQIIKNIVFNVNKTTVPRHLGRWNNNQTLNNIQLKIDYANIDSCGDSLCGLPDHFKPLPVNKGLKSKL
jgi:hypothetical protein